MEPPVNFENFHALTGGDADLERDLLNVFLASAFQCITEMRNAQISEKESEWKSQAHALKGICMNVGAAPLTQLCMKAQQDYRADSEEKQKLLHKITQEFSRVQDAIKQAI